MYRFSFIMFIQPSFDIFRKTSIELFWEISTLDDVNVEHVWWLIVVHLAVA